MKIRSIQYLRAAAALMVVVAHALLHPTTQVDVTYQRMGSFGVLLFFVISGFIMVYTNGEGSFSPGKFLRRRLERIVPLYWMVTIGVALLAAVAPSLLRYTTFSWSQLFGSLLFIPYYRDNGEIVPLMKLGWTLNYEMFFYVAFAAAAPLTAGRRVLLISAAFVALVVLGAMVPFHAAIPKFYTEQVLLTFCIGMAVGLIYQRGIPAACAPGMTPVWIGATILFAGLAFSAPPAQPLGPLTDGLFTLAAASLVLAGLCAERHLPVSRAGAILGDSSYAMYLTHMYFVGGSILVVRKLTGMAVPWLDVMSAVLLTVIISVPIHRYVEVPIGRWFRRFDPGARRRRAPAASA